MCVLFGQPIESVQYPGQRSLAIPRLALATHGRYPHDRKSGNSDGRLGNSNGPRAMLDGSCRKASSAREDTVTTAGKCRPPCANGRSGVTSHWCIGSELCLTAEKLLLGSRLVWHDFRKKIGDGGRAFLSGRIATFDQTIKEQAAR